MQSDKTFIGLETHVGIIVETMENITLIVESENKRMLRQGNAQAVAANRPLHQRKLQLYRRFETLARIISQMARVGALEDKAIAASMMPSLLHLQHAITVNSALLKRHIETRQHLLNAIMRGIEKRDEGHSVCLAELDICL